ncbi:MAG: GTPase [Lachnospiraceae bacterium]|nr:GTPase [Lachnospiraceae bacterium]
MDMTETVVFVNGFLEAGKTTFIKELLDRDGFKINGKMLLIVCEEGEEEYDRKELEQRKVYVEYLENEEDFTPERISEMERRIRPDIVIVEYNGMWRRKDLRFPDNWQNIVEVAIIDAATFKIYSENLRVFLAEQVRTAEMVIFNRCDGVREKLADYGRNIKAVNPGVCNLFRGAEGDIVLDPDESLPYDISKDILELDDPGFFAFFMDVHERCEKYIGKMVSFRAKAYQTKTDEDFLFVAGRQVMACCEADISFIGFLCSYPKAYELKNREWIRAVGKMKMIYDEAAGRQVPLCRITSLEVTEAPEEEIMTISAM